MLADDVVHRLRSANPLQNAVYRAFADGVEQAQRFVVTTEALGVTQSLAYDRPTTLLSAMQVIRSPFPKVWFEHDQADVAEARRRYDDDDRRPLEGHESRIRRVGILVETVGDERSYIAMPVVQFVDGAFWLMMHCGTADFGEDAPRSGPWAREFDDARQLDYDRLTGHSELAARRAKYLDDPEERLAMMGYHGRFDYRVMPHMAEQLRLMGRSTSLVAGLSGTGEEINYAGWAAREAAKNLILLNLKNGVEIRAASASRDAQKARRRMGRPPLLDHHVLGLKLPRHIVRDGTQASPGDAEDMRAHWVRGHLKVRSTGVYWWSPHIRGDPSLGFVDKTYAMRP